MSSSNLKLKASEREERLREELEETRRQLATAIAIATTATAIATSEGKAREGFAKLAKENVFVHVLSQIGSNSSTPCSKSIEPKYTFWPNGQGLVCNLQGSTPSMGAELSMTGTVSPWAKAWFPFTLNLLGVAMSVRDLSAGGALNHWSVKIGFASLLLIGQLGCSFASAVLIHNDAPCAPLVEFATQMASVGLGVWLACCTLYESFSEDEALEPDTNNLA